MIDVSEQTPLYGMNIYQAWDWIDKNIEYKPDFIDDFQLPETTYRIRTGDCEDFCILLMSVMNQQGPSPELICITNEDKWHYIISWKGMYIDAQVCGKFFSKNYVESNFIWRISYIESIMMGH